MKETIYKLSPLAKSLTVGNEERLTWLRNFFYRLKPARQKQIFPYLKNDLQLSLIRKGYVHTAK